MHFSSGGVKENQIEAESGNFFRRKQHVYLWTVVSVRYHYKKSYSSCWSGTKRTYHHLTCTIIELLKKYIVDYMAYIFTLLMFRKSNKTTIKLFSGS
jgi:hypothetical protein